MPLTVIATTGGLFSAGTVSGTMTVNVPISTYNGPIGSTN